MWYESGAFSNSDRISLIRAFDMATTDQTLDTEGGSHLARKTSALVGMKSISILKGAPLHVAKSRLIDEQEKAFERVILDCDRIWNYSEECMQFESVRFNV